MTGGDGFPVMRIDQTVPGSAHFRMPVRECLSFLSRGILVGSDRQAERTTGNENKECQMKDFIAYCGLDCETCDARIATVRDDQALREKVARLWSDLNHVEITPDMIHCGGCRIDGAKTPYCESLCPIRQCALGKTVGTCGDCPDMETCAKVGMVIGNNPQALNNLKGGGRDNALP